MKIGASTKSFGGMSVSEAAQLFARCGLSLAELCFCMSDLSGWRYNLCGYEPLPGGKQVSDAVEAFRKCSVEICAIGVYCNFWSGSTDEIYDSMQLFTQYCDIALACGVKTLTTHTGTTALLPLSQGFGNRLRQKLYSGFTYACIEAEKRGLTLAVECGENDALQDYDEYLALKQHVEKCIGRSNMLKYIYTPAFSKKAPDSEMAMIHLRDRKKDGKYFERFGEGDVDFTPLFSDFGQNKHLPVILEYVNSANLADTVKRFRETAF